VSKLVERGTFGAPITAEMAGKKISHFEQNGLFFIVVATDGTAANIGWKNEDTGKQLRGVPFLHNLDMRIKVPAGVLFGKGNS